MALTRAALAETLRIPAPGAGAAPPATWSDDSFVIALHSSGSLLAVAGQQRAVIFRAVGPLADAELPAPVVPAVCAATEHVTAMAWAAFDGQNDESCLVIGTSAGWLQLHSDTGTLLHRQQLHTLPVLRLHARSSCMGLASQDGASDITAMFADAAARVSGLEVRSVVRLQRQSWTEPDRLAPLGFTKWDLQQKAAGPRSDGMCIGVRPPTLQTLMKGGYTAPKLTIVAVGSKPPIAAFEVEEHTQRGAIAMVSDIAQSLKGWIPSPMRRVKEVKRQPAEPATLSAEIQDDKTRTITSLVLAPRGVLAVATDTLGRVMLLDLAVLAVVRLWKGYRDAQCTWVTAAAAASPDTAEPNGGSGGRQRKRPKQEALGAARDAEVLLVIYAPRKGVCDVYACRHGPVLQTLQCGANCRLLQPSAALGPPGGGSTGSPPTDCLLLDFDSGSLTSLQHALADS